MLRTIELILGIPPMSQYDAAATPMWRSFASTADSKGFTARPANINLSEKNTAMNEWQRRSEKFDLAKKMRRRILNSIKYYGTDSKEIMCRSLHHAALLSSNKQKWPTGIKLFVNDPK